MASKTQVKFKGIDKVVRNADEYVRKLNDKAIAVMGYTMAEAEASAKRNAPWTDRTGNARNSIIGRLVPDMNKIVGALSIGMPYGVNLELGYQGRYRIVWPTVLEYRQSLLQMLKRVCSNIKV